MTDEKYVPPARCPWCGGHARVRAFTGGDCVECDRCHASGPMTMLGERAAITAWNKRVARRGERAPAQESEHCVRDKRLLQGQIHGPNEEPVDVPEHYRGDCVVSAARALRSAASQPTKTERTETAFYWWALAFKYVWRLWSKGQAERDAEKAIDCLKRVIGELDEGEEA